jgi:hypothetical protein
MHCHRLLYDELVSEAEEKMELMDKLFKESKLPSTVPSNLTHNILLDIRKNFYTSVVA